MIGVEQYLNTLQTGLWAYILIFLRVGSAVLVIPGIGEQMIPARIRLSLALVLTFVIAPAASQVLPLVSFTFQNFVFALMTESISGIFLGLVLRLFVLAIQTAGAIAAQSTSLSQLMGGTSADPLPAMGHILTIAALALLMATGFHVKLASYLILSYDILPALQFPSARDIAQSGRGRVSESFSLAFSLAAPFVILSVLYNLTLGVINKAMPQLMVAFVGAPVITFGAIGLLFISAPLILTTWLSAVESFLANPLR